MITLRLAGALVICLTLGFTGTADAASGVFGAGVKKFSPQARAGKSVTFRVVGIEPSKVRRGYIRAGRYHRRVRTASLRRAAGTKRIALRVPRSSGRRRAVRLVVLLKQARISKPRRVEESRGGVETLPADSATPITTELPATEATPPAPTAETTVEPAPAPAAVSGEKSTTRPVGTAILSDAEAAAHVRRSGWEPRPGNAAANQRTPQPGELDGFLANNISVYGEHKPLVTGNFTGTTDEVIQWAAWKWGLDEDVLRAVVVKESWWRTSAVGDGGLSFGLTQIKTTFHAGTHPLSAASTAFNVDYYGALFRYYFDGHARWLNDMDKGQNYASGDLWGAVGAHYAGRWHTAAADGYITSVQRHLQQRTWTSADF
jgi:autotransporter family porin